ncbi:MAG: hypothetical protein J7578_04915 [Chitinophagaceae bacterium]|nr:hypothetical protein [Chitinophagaceae bacterium]
MKFLLLILLAGSTFSVFAQNNQAVELRWKIGKNEKLLYATVMNEIDTSRIQVKDSSANAATENKADPGKYSSINKPTAVLQIRS